MYDEKRVLLQNIVGAEYMVYTHWLNILGAAAPTAPVVPTQCPEVNKCRRCHSTAPALLPLRRLVCVDSVMACCFLGFQWPASSATRPVAAGRRSAWLTPPAIRELDRTPLPPATVRRSAGPASRYGGVRGPPAPFRYSISSAKT